MPHVRKSSPQRVWRGSEEQVSKAEVLDVVLWEREAPPSADIPVTTSLPARCLNESTTVSLLTCQSSSLSQLPLASFDTDIDCKHGNSYRVKSTSVHFNASEWMDYFRVSPLIFLDNNPCCPRSTSSFVHCRSSTILGRLCGPPATKLMSLIFGGQEIVLIQPQTFLEFYSRFHSCLIREGKLVRDKMRIIFKKHSVPG